jgi:hypothetical protein
MPLYTSHNAYYVNYNPDPQQLPLCRGGHGVSPYEQNTQQSPAFGASTSPHAGQSKKNWQASVGIMAALR